MSPRYPMQLVAFDRSSQRPMVYSHLEAAVSRAAASWAVEGIVDPNGELGVIVMPPSGNDTDGPTLAIWEHESSYRVDEVRWDRYRTVARCSTIADCLIEIRRRMQIESGSAASDHGFQATN